MHRMTIACCLIALSLTACGRSHRSASITINSGDGNDSLFASTGDGDVSVSLPGLQTRMRLPKLTLGDQNIDMNGVRLYPGSTVSAMNVDAHGKAATVHIGFTSPARPPTVRDWFAHQMQDEHFSVKPTGDGLTGKTDDGKPFALHLTADGADRANGEMVLGA